jgi:hypothetical protein
MLAVYLKFAAMRLRDSLRSTAVSLAAMPAIRKFFFGGDFSLAMARPCD